MAKKTLVEQIKDTQIELEKVRAEKKQKENQLAKIQKQEREKEHRVRTRRLIQKGAVLESVDPNLACRTAKTSDQKSVSKIQN